MRFAEGGRIVARGEDLAPYRVGNHQPQNVYRGDEYIGVMFSARDAEEAREARRRERTATS